MVKELKSVSVSFRVSPRFRELLAAAAAKEHRSQANLLEMLLYSHCEQQGIYPSPKNHSTKK
jgi:hypothetical protein